MEITFLSSLEPNDWALVISTLLGPILAVQAQKVVEKFRIKNQRKNFVFEQLMATRGARLSREHVTALNMIDLVFYGTISMGKTSRSKEERKVLDAWKEYHDHLSSGNGEGDENQAALWYTKGDELFINLLYVMSLDLKYSFDRVQLKKGSYSPIGHVNLDNEQANLRKSMIDVLEGRTSIKMNIDQLNIK